MQQYLADIEEHLGETIPKVSASFDVPVNEYDGKITYGEKRTGNGLKFETHIDLLAPSVDELSKLERMSQSIFLKMREGGSGAR